MEYKILRPAEILDPHLLGLGIDTFQLESGEERVTLFPRIIGRLSYSYPPTSILKTKRESVFSNLVHLTLDIQLLECATGLQAQVDCLLLFSEL